MPTILFASLASLFWGCADFLAGIETRRLMLMRVLVITQLAGLVAAVVLLAIVRDARPSVESVLLGTAAGVSGIVSIAAFYTSLAVGAVSVAAPIVSTGALLPLAYGLLSGDHPTASQAVGMSIALGGLVLVAGEPNRGLQGRLLVPGAGLAFAAALTSGLFLLAMAQASKESWAWAALFARLTSTGLVAIAWPLVGHFRRRGRRLSGSDAGVLIVIGLLDVGGLALYAFAASVGALSLTSVVASLYPVVTVLLAFAVLGERLGRRQRIGAVAALTGTALISS